MHSPGIARSKGTNVSPNRLSTRIRGASVEPAIAEVGRWGEEAEPAAPLQRFDFQLSDEGSVAGGYNNPDAKGATRSAPGGATMDKQADRLVQAYFASLAMSEIEDDAHVAAELRHIAERTRLSLASGGMVPRLINGQARAVVGTG